VRHHRRLLGLAVRREIPGEQDQVDAVAQPRERRGPPLLVAGAAEMNVTRRGDADRAFVAPRVAPGVVRGLCHPTSSPSPTSRRR
jgi:hypothetical protein